MKQLVLLLIGIWFLIGEAAQAQYNPGPGNPPPGNPYGPQGPDGGWSPEDYQSKAWLNLRSYIDPPNPAVMPGPGSTNGPMTPFSDKGQDGPNTKKFCGVRPDKRDPVYNGVYEHVTNTVSLIPADYPWDWPTFKTEDFFLGIKYPKVSCAQEWIRWRDFGVCYEGIGYLLAYDTEKPPWYCDECGSYVSTYYHFANGILGPPIGTGPGSGPVGEGLYPMWWDPNCLYGDPQCLPLTREEYGRGWNNYPAIYGIPNTRGPDTYGYNDYNPIKPEKPHYDYDTIYDMWEIRCLRDIYKKVDYYVNFIFPCPPVFVTNSIPQMLHQRQFWIETKLSQDIYGEFHAYWASPVPSPDKTTNLVGWNYIWQNNKNIGWFVLPRRTPSNIAALRDIDKRIYPMPLSPTWEFTEVNLGKISNDMDGFSAPVRVPIEGCITNAEARYYYTNCFDPAIWDFQVKCAQCGDKYTIDLNWVVVDVQRTNQPSVVITADPPMSGLQELYPARGHVQLHSQTRPSDLWHLRVVHDLWMGQTPQERTVTNTLTMEQTFTFTSFTYTNTIEWDNPEPQKPALKTIFDFALLSNTNAGNYTPGNYTITQGGLVLQTGQLGFPSTNHLSILNTNPAVPMTLTIDHLCQDTIAQTAILNQGTPPTIEVYSLYPDPNNPRQISEDSPTTALFKIINPQPGMGFVCAWDDFKARRVFTNDFIYITNNWRQMAWYAYAAGPLQYPSDVVSNKVAIQVETPKLELADKYVNDVFVGMTNLTLNKQAFVEQAFTLVKRWGANTNSGLGLMSYATNGLLTWFLNGNNAPDYEDTNHAYKLGQTGKIQLKMAEMTNGCWTNMLYNRTLPNCWHVPEATYEPGKLPFTSTSWTEQDPDFKGFDAVPNDGKKELPAGDPPRSKTGIGVVGTRFQVDDLRVTKLRTNDFYGVYKVSTTTSNVIFKYTAFVVTNKNDLDTVSPALPPDKFVYAPENPVLTNTAAQQIEVTLDGTTNYYAIFDQVYEGYHAHFAAYRPGYTPGYHLMERIVLFSTERDPCDNTLTFTMNQSVGGILMVTNLFKGPGSIDTNALSGNFTNINPHDGEVVTNIFVDTNWWGGILYPAHPHLTNGLRQVIWPWNLPIGPTGAVYTAVGWDYETDSYQTNILELPPPYKLGLTVLGNTLGGTNGVAWTTNNQLLVTGSTNLEPVLAITNSGPVAFALAPNQDGIKFYSTNICYGLDAKGQEVLQTNRFILNTANLPDGTSYEQKVVVLLQGSYRDCPPKVFKIPVVINRTGALIFEIPRSPNTNQNCLELATNYLSLPKIP